MTTWTSSDGVQHEEQYVQSTSQQRLKWLFQNLPSDYSPEKDRELVLSESTEDTDGQPTKIWRSYYVERAAVLTNESIEEAETQYTADGRVGVSLSFDAAGAARFAAHTETHVGRKLAIMFEGVVRSAPVVEGKISGGRASISLGASVDPAAARREAEDLVAILRAGQLPVPLILVGEHRLPSP